LTGGGMPQRIFKFTEWLRGSDIILTPDNDDVSHAAIDWIAHQLNGTASNIRCFDLVKVTPLWGPVRLHLVPDDAHSSCKLGGPQSALLAKF
jgi:hypothetical protein